MCTSVQALNALARGTGIWEGLPKAVRKAQLEAMATLCRELYPTFRWYLYDAHEVFSAPLTIFGPRRAVLYIGQMYLVFNAASHVRTLTTHFDHLIRHATVPASSCWDRLDDLRADL